MKEKRRSYPPKRFNQAQDGSVSFDEPCPCGTGKTFGHCCGRSEPCPCRSGLLAEECCYPEEASQTQEAPQLGNTTQN